MAVADAQFASRLERIVFRKSLLQRTLETIPRLVVLRVHVARQRFIVFYPRIVRTQFASIFEFLRSCLVVAFLIRRYTIFQQSIK